MQNFSVKTLSGVAMTKEYEMNNNNDLQDNKRTGDINIQRIKKRLVEEVDPKSREEAEEFLGQDGQMIDYMVAAVVKGAVNLGSVGDGFRYGPSRLHGVYQVQGLANALDQSAAALRARLHRPAVGVQGAAGDSAAWAL